MFGFIKKLFSGIISFFVGLVGDKKSKENKPSQPSLAEKTAEATAKTSNEVLSSVSGLVGGKKPEENKPSQTSSQKRKRNGYFMELDEAEDKQSVNRNQPAKVEAAKSPEPAAKTAKTPEPAAAKTSKQEPAKTQQMTVEQASKKAEQVAKKVELVQTADGLKLEPKKPASASPAASANGQTPTENTFAPKYLTPTSTNSRRRPGPSMSNFLDMARQVKTPG